MDREQFLQQLFPLIGGKDNTSLCEFQRDSLYVTLKDAGLAEGGYDAYREADPMAEIVLLPTRSVTDFHYFIVGFREGGDQLTLTRDDDLYTADALSPGRPLLLAIPFVETIPNRGISYVDADGALRQYAIVESEKDGTIFLMEEAFDSAA